MPDRVHSTQSGDLITEVPERTLKDLCSACGLSTEKIEAYVAEGIIEPHGSGREQWRFSHISVIKVRKAKRLERDLGLNTAGVALALDLMTQIETLKGRLARFEWEVKESATEN